MIYVTLNGPPSSAIPVARRNSHSDTIFGRLLAQYRAKRPDFSDPAGLLYWISGRVASTRIWFNRVVRLCDVDHSRPRRERHSHPVARPRLPEALVARAADISGQRRLLPLHCCSLPGLNAVAPAPICGQQIGTMGT